VVLPSVLLLFAITANIGFELMTHLTLKLVPFCLLISVVLSTVFICWPFSRMCTTVIILVHYIKNIHFVRGINWILNYCCI